MVVRSEIECVSPVRSRGKFCAFTGGLRGFYTTYADGQWYVGPKRTILGASIGSPNIDDTSYVGES